MSLSTRQLQRISRDCFAQSPQEILDRQRMGIAADLLREGHSTKEIAEVLHFKQLSHFYRKFKEHHGVTPGDFQARRGVRAD